MLISVFAGYLIGHPFEVPMDWKRFLLTLLGVGSLASGSSALNQVQEIDQDKQMPRTAKRPLPSGRIGFKSALIFIFLTLSIGLAVLYWVDTTVFGLGILAVVLYNGFYTLWWKKYSAFAAIPGAIPGALPILMGYAAASGGAAHPAGLYLFFILFFWQMPHFWSLALKYREDYEQGGFPTLPVKHGQAMTIHHIILWSLAYVGLAVIAPLFIHVHWIYEVAALLMCTKLLFALARYVKNPSSKEWLSFFLCVNFSLIVFLAAAVVDLWSVYLPIQGYTR